VSRATAGTGLAFEAQVKQRASGTESAGDVPSAYLTFLRRGDDQSLGTYLVSGDRSYWDIAETVPVDGKAYEVTLRSRRIHKPYTIQLIDFRLDTYLGTSKAKNLSSDVRLIDPDRGVDREVKIWMNNPLRYAGETFYQSGHEVAPHTGAEVTILQVVNNRGWMLPYVSCTMVATGLLAHFGIGLVCFLRQRLADQSRFPQRPLGATRSPHRSLHPAAFPLLVVSLCTVWVGSKAISPTHDKQGWRLDEFGKLPLVYEGRVKPFDTLARNSLSRLSQKQTFRDRDGARQPAVRWLLDVISRTQQGRAHQVFRIENMELLDVLGLERRKGFRYAIEEFHDSLDKFSHQVRLAREREETERTTFQRKVLEVDHRMGHFRVLEEAFRPAVIRAGHEREDLLAAMQQVGTWAQYQPPLAVFDESSSERTWQSLAEAWAVARGRQLLGHPPNPLAMSLHSILDAYRDRDAVRFNAEVLNYQALLDDLPPEVYDARKVRFEAFFNHWQPYTTAAALYVAAFLLASLAWLTWSGPFNRAAFWLVVFTFVLHTFALLGRMYISGRPPVTNLYSSAILVGWGCVLLGMLVEMVYPIGMGIVVSAVSGFSTLLIAHFLARGGDTLAVLQAVLDTQFWLATHVTCIVLGYSATFVAGALGLLYILRGVLTPSLTPRLAEDLSRMIYGTLCFALLFTFVGTVLGGLWADDSWGRFWGWDPKENGALIIVLWNALELHARWCGMASDRAVAVLAVGGNLCTAWSWFGTNELAVGLHSYGFTDGVLPVLGLFGATQLLIMAIGMLPRRWWWSCGRAPTTATDNGN
jgi:ABC-type transport system involved in cytochrome c biogenesis permease subunit